MKVNFRSHRLYDLEAYPLAARRVAKGAGLKDGHIAAMMHPSRQAYVEEEEEREVSPVRVCTSYRLQWCSYDIPEACFFPNRGLEAVSLSRVSADSYDHGPRIRRWEWTSTIYVCYCLSIMYTVLN